MAGTLPVTEIIDRKRRGEALEPAAIEAVVAGFTRGAVPDYQMAALLMAIVLRGMSDTETVTLTQAMARSGAMLDLSDIAPIVADKHSTGGVGDKTTLVVAPLVAACGVHVGKMTGRSLGHTGGTVDKLESISGFTAMLDAERFKALLRAHRLVLAGQSADLAPADGLIYALRDATATVQSIPLIASSIMSKKLAAGATAILLDVKVGRGAFMETLAEARQLADLMVAIGQQAGRRTQAVLSAMDQPLGRAIGNALEVAEAVATLRGEGPPDFEALCRHEAGLLLALAGAAADAAAGERQAAAALRSGAALERLATVVAAQGGDARQIESLARLPAAPVVREVASPRSGWIAGLDALALGRLVVRLGGGRQRKGEAIDHRVGLMLRAKVGDRLVAGDPLATVHPSSSPESGNRTGIPQSVAPRHCLGLPSPAGITLPPQPPAPQRRL
jgi:pyrimidine-nucleoside phosphorylase